MPLAIETVVGSYAAAATATAQAYTAGTSQSFNVRASNGSPGAHVECLWTQSQDAGYTRVRSPRLHDDVIGVEVQHYVNNTNPLLDEYFEQSVYSQDTLIVEDYFTAAPVAAHVQQIGFNVYYDDLPGVTANLMPWAQVKSMIQSYYGVYVLPISNAAAGSWGAGVAVNSSQDNFKANSWYALLGYITPTRFTAFSLLGTDIGNLYYGGPGSIDPIITRKWFVDQEMKTGRPSIPVINSQNKGSTLVQVFDTALTATYPISLLFAYLGPVS